MKREQKLMVSSAFHGLLVLHIRFRHLSFSLVSLAGLLRLLFFQTMSALSPLLSKRVVSSNRLPRFLFFFVTKKQVKCISMEFSYRKRKIHLSWLIEIVEEKTRGKITDRSPSKTNAEEFQRGKTVAAL